MLNIIVAPRRIWNCSAVVPAVDSQPTIPVNQILLPDGTAVIVIVCKVVGEAPKGIDELPHVFGVFSDT